MKRFFINTISLALFIACNSSGGRNNISDSLGNRITDSPRRDTGYYERMQQKTGPTGDSTSFGGNRGDTGYYERMQNRSNPPDSSR